MAVAAKTYAEEARRFWIIRTASGMTQTEVKDLLHTSATQMSQMESGAVNPINSSVGREFLLRIGADFNYLIAGRLNPAGWLDDAMYKRVLELERATPRVEWRRSAP